MRNQRKYHIDLCYDTKILFIKSCPSDMLPDKIHHSSSIKLYRADRTYQCTNGSGKSQCFRTAKIKPL